MINYQDSIENIFPDMLSDFFVGWSKPPSTETHLKLLKNSDFIVIAIDDDIKKVVGFMTAITDSTLVAYIPFLEVLPKYQNKKIGQKLIEKMLKKLKGFYMVDLLCDKNLQGYYEKFGMHKATGVMIRNFDKQSGK